MKTLKLFNCVLAKESNNDKPFVSKEGYVIMPNALWAKDEIISYFRNEKLNGNDLNKTFHKSWKKIEESSRYELYLHQIVHYFSTYGTNFVTDPYIPNEVLDIPDLKLKFKIINGLSKDEIIRKCLNLLESGIALKQETIEDVFDVLIKKFNYQFIDSGLIKNKEAKIYIADVFGVLPSDPVDLLRFVVYKSTNETLLIKNDLLIQKIKIGQYNPDYVFNNFGLKKLARIFNRFKPLFLAYKNKCPKTINKISRFSKNHHVPLVENPLNKVTNTKLKNRDNKWLDNATIFALFKALNGTYQRSYGNQDTFMYRIRNGKSWVSKKDLTGEEIDINFYNHDIILNHLKERLNITNKTVYLPSNIEYALPTSEKMFVGNIPTGTKFIGKKLVVGIYWENSWGAHDLDLSGINIGGKVGWNSDYKQGSSLYYSGDITDAPDGAVEYLYANQGLSDPTIIMNNVFSGDDNCDYKILIGKGDNINYNYMMNPNNLILDEKVTSPQNQTIIGIIIPNSKLEQEFVLLNVGSGGLSVSGYDKKSKDQTNAMYQQWTNSVNVRHLLNKLDVEIVDNPDDADIDLSVDSLEKDTFLDLFK